MTTDQVLTQLCEALNQGMNRFEQRGETYDSIVEKHRASVNEAMYGKDYCVINQRGARFRGEGKKQMSKLFLDCEFNGLHGELISMALVSDDHAEWYQTVAVRGRIDPWVAEHVIPYLSATFTAHTRERSDHEDLAASLDAFLSNFDNPEIIADWPADFEHFGNLLTIIGANGGFKEAYACTMRLINTPPLKPEVPHNALSDARALRDWYVAQEIAA